MTAIRIETIGLGSGQKLTYRDFGTASRCFPAAVPERDNGPSQ